MNYELQMPRIFIYPQYPLHNIQHFSQKSPRGAWAGIIVLAALLSGVALAKEDQKIPTFDIRNSLFDIGYSLRLLSSVLEIRFTLHEIRIVRFEQFAQGGSAITAQNRVKTAQFLRIFYNFYHFFNPTCAFGWKNPRFRLRVWCDNFSQQDGVIAGRFRPKDR